MKSFRQRFNSIITEGEREPTPKRPRYDDAEDITAFNDSVDADVDAEEYDVDGLGDEVYSAVDETTQEIIRWAEDIGQFTKKLIDPENPDALLSKLASVSNIPEFATAAETVSKHLTKAVSEIGQGKTALDALASLAASRRDARKSGDAEQSGASGPY